MGQGKVLEMNSREWWDRYFQEHWETNDGRNQTRGFMRSLIVHLPDAEIAHLLSRTTSILDWGCALGDGVDILSSVFPSARVAGLDFSGHAIDVARRDYPALEFLHTPDGTVPYAFDVIITSNCLEHFEFPLDIAQKHLLNCRQLYIAMMPYDEQELLDQHRARFVEDTFPQFLDGFVRLVSQPIDVPTIYWPGRQLLVVYGSPSYAEERLSAEISPSLRTAVDHVRASLLAAEQSHLGKQVVLSKNEVRDLWALVQEKDSAIDKLQGDLGQQRFESDQLQLRTSELWGLAQEKEGALTELRKQGAELLAHLQETERTAERNALADRQRRQELERMLRDSTSREAELQAGVNSLRNDRDGLAGQLNVYYRSKAWRWSVAYWNLRHLGAKGIIAFLRIALSLLLLPARVAYSVVHALYHLLVPYRIRNAFWEYRWRLRHRNLPTDVASTTLAFQPHNTAEQGREQRLPTSRKALRDIYIFAMVPYFDIGGGQRSAQLAKTFDKMGYAVHYVHAYDSTDAGERDAYIPAVRHVHVKNLSPRDIIGELRGAPVFVFEAPHKDFEPYLDLAAKIHARVIYEHIDNWDTSLGSFFFSIDTLNHFLRCADVIVATTRLLCERIADYMQSDPTLSARADEVEYVANAVDSDLFDHSRAYTLPADLVKGAPTLLYYGSLWGKWFDWDLIRQVADRCPNCSINLIGDYQPVEKLVHTLPENVHFLGPRKQTELPPYLAHCDFALLPFKNDEIGKYVSPLKIFEYVSMDKPVLSTALPDILGYPGVHTADSIEDWVRVVRSEEGIDTGAGPTFAAANNWYARCNHLIDLIEPVEPVEPADVRSSLHSISIVVLNHDNRKVIERCVDSLLAFRSRYDYEVIVVDNQSTDGSCEFLSEHYGDAIVLVRNERNGCSSGRNLGLRHASGDLILFVDSDQWVVSARWLDAPLAVLHEHRRIGAVGANGGWFYPGSVGGPITAYLAHGGIEPGILFRTDIGYLGTSGMLVRREALNGETSFDEFYDPTCYEDTDLSLQIRDQGFELAYCPYMNLNHIPHQTTQSGSESHSRLMERNGAYFREKWHARDPRLMEYYLGW